MIRRVSLSTFLVFVRIDPVKFNRIVFSESISLQNCAAALLFYAVAMVVNLVMMQTEDALRMTQYTSSATNVTNALVRNQVREKCAETNFESSRTTSWVLKVTGGNSWQLSEQPLFLPVGLLWACMWKRIDCVWWSRTRRTMLSMMSWTSIRMASP